MDLGESARLAVGTLQQLKAMVWLRQPGTIELNLRICFR
jgi:hypothetical protein